MVEININKTNYKDKHNKSFHHTTSKQSALTLKLNGRHNFNPLHKLRPACYPLKLNINPPNMNIFPTPNIFALFFLPSINNTN